MVSRIDFKEPNFYVDLPGGHDSFSMTSERKSHSHRSLLIILNLFTLIIMCSNCLLVRNSFCLLSRL